MHQENEELSSHEKNPNGPQLVQTGPNASSMELIASPGTLWYVNWGIVVSKRQGWREITNISQ